VGNNRGLRIKKRGKGDFPGRMGVTFKRGTRPEGAKKIIEEGEIT